MQTNHLTKFHWMRVSLTLSIVLLVSKLGAYYLTRSTAVLTDALESIINVVASAFAFYSIYLSGQPRDQNHPYGHGKVEFLSSAFEGALILSAGLFILVESTLSFFEPRNLQNLDWGLAIVCLTTLVNAVLGWKLVQTGRRTDSLALIADGRHLLTDSVSSLVVVVGIGLIWLTGYSWLDSVLSIILAGVILFNGFVITRQSVARLMDAADLPTLKRIVAVLNKRKSQNWIDVHNLRVQKYGADLHIDCHLTLPYYWDLERVHNEVHVFEDALKEASNSQVELFVHTDPCLKECCHYCRVANCPVRAFPFVRDVEWTPENLPLNQKHFVPIELQNV